MTPQLATASSTDQGPSGLAAQEAAQRLRRDGPNELPQERRRDPARIVIVLDAGREPMLQLLLAAGVIYLFVADGQVCPGWQPR